MDKLLDPKEGQSSDTIVQMQPQSGRKPRRLSESSSDSESSSSSSTDDSKAFRRLRRPNQYIPLDYEELMQMLGGMVDGQKPADWAMHWRMVFGVNLPLYANVRTVEIFKPLIEQYEDLDPTPRTVGPPPPPPGEEADAEAGVSAVTLGSDKARELRKTDGGEDALKSLQQPLCGDRASARHRDLPMLRAGLHPTGPPPPPRGDGTAGSAAGFREDSLDSLLQMCGFQEVPEEFIREADEEEGKQGLNVHVPPAKELPTRVYYRGLVEKEETRRPWQSCYCKRKELQKVFLTLVFVYSYNYQPEDAPDNLCSRLWWRACNEARRRAVGPPGSDGKVFMHAYTSISLPDMDMLWPASKPNPTFFDTVSILVPLLVALGSSLWKLIGVVVDVDDLTDTANLLVILFAIVAPFSIAFRYFMKAKNKYYLYKARHADTLVQHTHSTNRGALSSLLEDATAQESKEIVVAYTLLAIAPRPLTMEELRVAANSVLQRVSCTSPEVGYDIEFDTEDPVRDLDHLGVLVRHEGGRLGVKDLQEVKRAISLQRFEQQMEKRARQRLADLRAASGAASGAARSGQAAKRRAA